MKRLFPVFVLALCSAATAQLGYRGSVEVNVDATANAALPSPQVGWTLAGNVTFDYNFEPFLVTAVLDPSVRFSRAGVALEPGLTEAYALALQGDFDLSVGAERLPLETARLSIPFGVERTDTRGVRRGVPSARVSYYLDDWRLRGAVFYQDTLDSVTPLVSARRGFGDFELEAHALYPGEVAVGLAGSGLVADLVLYGEAWLLTDPLEGRGALGLNGNLDAGTWTLEAAYLPPGESNLKGDVDAEVGEQQLKGYQADALAPRPALLSQVAWPFGEAGDMSVLLFGSAFLDPDAVRVGASASFSVLAGDQELTLSTGGAFGPEPATLTFNLDVKQYLGD